MRKQLRLLFSKDAIYISLHCESLEYFWCRLSMKLSLAPLPMQLVMGALTSKETASPCQQVVMSSMLLPTSMLVGSVQLCMDR